MVSHASHRSNPVDHHFLGFLGKEDAQPSSRRAFGLTARRSRSPRSRGSPHWVARRRCIVQLCTCATCSECRYTVESADKLPPSIAPAVDSIALEPPLSLFGSIPSTSARFNSPNFHISGAKCPPSRRNILQVSLSF